MDLKLSEEEKLVKEAAAQFVEKELLRREGSYLKQQEPFLPPGDPPRRDLDSELRGSLVEKAKAAGLWALELPEEAGGSGVSHIARVLIHREFGKTVLPFEPPTIPAVTVAGGYAKRIAEGEISLSLAFHEMHETGKPDRIQTTYRRYSDPSTRATASGRGPLLRVVLPSTCSGPEFIEGSERSESKDDVVEPRALPVGLHGYCLDGSGGDLIRPASELFLLPAKEESSQNVGLFLLDRDVPGLSIREEVDLTTDETVARLMLRECRVPRGRLVGDENDIRRVVAGEQLRIAARSLGIGTRCLEASLEHARNRVTFGRPLSLRQAIQWMVADLSISLNASTWLTLEAAWKADQGLPYFEAAALAKKKAARMAFEAADVAIQIHGGYGVCKEFPFEAFYRAARWMRLVYGQEAEIDGEIGERFLKEGNRQ